MNKRIWNLYAPLYERAMRGDRKVYQFMYDRIPRVIRGKEVLELATGPGLLAKHVAHAAKRLGGPVPKGRARHTGIHGRHDRGRHLGQPERSIFLPPSGGFYFLWYPQSQYGPPDANVYCRMNSLPPPTSPSAILHISSCFPPVFNPKSQKSCLCQTACFSASNYNWLGREMQPVSGSLCFADGRQWAERPENAVSLARKPHLCYTVVSQEKLRRMLAGGTLCL